MRKEAFQKIVFSLENESERWRSGNFGFCFERDDGLTIWADLFVHIYEPDPIKLTLRQKYLIKKSINKCKENKIILMSNR